MSPVSDKLRALIERERRSPVDAVSRDATLQYIPFRSRFATDRTICFTGNTKWTSSSGAVEIPDDHRSGSTPITLRPASLADRSNERIGADAGRISATLSTCGIRKCARVVWTRMALGQWYLTAGSRCVRSRNGVVNMNQTQEASRRSVYSAGR
jgi:hypothetical protein